MGLGPGDAGRTDRDLSQWNYHTRLMYQNQLCLTTLIMGPRPITGTHFSESQSPHAK
jgi:hypothetical protein